MNLNFSSSLHSLSPWLTCCCRPERSWWWWWARWRDERMGRWLKKQKIIIRKGINDGRQPRSRLRQLPSIISRIITHLLLHPHHLHNKLIIMLLIMPSLHSGSLFSRSLCHNNQESKVRLLILFNYFFFNFQRRSCLILMVKMMRTKMMIVHSTLNSSSASISHQKRLH